MNTFKELNNSEKARVIKLLVGMGFRSLLDIELFYDEYQRNGGDMSHVGKPKPKQEEKRMTIRDWLVGRNGDNINKGVRNNVLYVDTGDKPYVKGSVAGLNPLPWVPSVDPVTGQPNPRPATFYYGDDGLLYTDPGSGFVPRQPMSQDEIADFFWQMENPDHRGLNQENGMYYKYRDPNGKDWDVGPGLVIGSAIEDKPYYTKEELDRATYKYHMDAMDKLAPLYDEKYGYGAFGNIDDRSKLVASDVMYRVGQNGVNPSTWPKMFDAINENNTADILYHSRSKFKDEKGVLNYDNARVKRLGEYLYPGEFEYIFRNSLDPNIRVRRVELKKNGGYLFSTGPEYPPVIQKVNRSKADFVQRLKDPNRAYIQDWDNPDNIATHKLSWADNGVVYPLVLNVNGKLVDFSRPPYDIWAGYDNAVRNGDTIHMTPLEAEWFTTHYKDYYPGFDEYKKGGSIHIKPENRGKFTALKKRTGHSASWFKAHGTPALRKMATFALNARKWHHKHPDGGSLFDKWRQYMQNNTVDVPVTFNLPEVQITAQAPRPGDANYDKYIANTYDAWKRGDVDINTLPTETRNRVRGYSGTIAALHGMDEAAKVAGMTAAVPAAIIGGISSMPYLYNLVTSPVGLKLTKQLLASEIGGRSVDLTSLAMTGKSWNENIGNLTYDITGWNPNNSMLGLVAVSFTNPGYMGLEGAKSLGKSIAYGWNNKLNDLSFKYGINKFVDNTTYPTNQFDNLTNYRSNVRTRKVIDKVIKDNPNLSYTEKQRLRYAARNMAYTNSTNRGFGTYQPINDKLPGSNLNGLFYDDNVTRFYEMNIPKYDPWSNTHEIGHIVDDVADGKFSSKLGIIPEYRYSSTRDIPKDKVELFADIFANTYSSRKPVDYLTFGKGRPWSLENRVNLTKGYKFGLNFQSILDKETELILRNPYLNKYLETVGTLEVKGPAAKIVHTLDEVTHGLYDKNDFSVLIKPLAEGADIERQLSKTGTISRNSLDAYIKKQGKFYQDVMNDVLNSDFSGTDKINYAEFKNAVSRKLPEYKRIPLELYKDYGLSDIGISSTINGESVLPEINDVYKQEKKVVDLIETYGNLEYKRLLWEIYNTQNENYKYDALLDLYDHVRLYSPRSQSNTKDVSTFTFESNGIIGDTKHYQGNPIGHSRTYTTIDEPDVLHVMESLSDWALSYEAPRLSLKGLNTHYERIERLAKEIDDNEEKFKLGFAPDGHKLEHDYEIQLVKDLILRDKDRLKELLSTIDEINNPNLYKHMTENYGSRLILENLKFAALRGLKKMRYPTRETAAKIEGYNSKEQLLKGLKYFDNSGKEINPIEAVELNDEGIYRLHNLQMLKKDYERWLNELELSNNPSSKEIEAVNEALFDIDSQINQLYRNSRYGSPKDGLIAKQNYIDQVETILKKYSDFPKQYKKLFKDADVRTITDSKGNTWYEVDVPEKYQKGKAEILMNLAPYLGLGLSSAALSKKKALGGPIKPFSYKPIPIVRY